MPTTVADRPSAARERLLRTASALFYGEGIRAVGVDRVIAEAGVTRATFYRHFPSKDDLVVGYLQEVDAAVRAAAAAAAPGAERLRAVVGTMGEQLCTSDFRGCAFVNAAIEFPDPASPVHRAVAAHRSWLAALFEEDLALVGHPDPAGAAAQLLLLRDGAMVAGNVPGTPGGQRRAATILLAGLERLLFAGSASTPPPAG